MTDLTTALNPLEPRPVAAAFDNGPGRTSAVSWAAIFAGAAGAAALSLLLLILGTGLGLSAVSPWTMEGISAATFGIATIAWLTFTQLAASGMGGYVAGRLRTRWTAVDRDEVFFRDTAHGFLTWAVAALLTAALLTSAMGSIVSGGVRAGAAVASGTASAVGAVASVTDADQVSRSLEYMVDSLFRGDGNAQGAEQAAVANRSQGAADGDESAAQQMYGQQREPAMGGQHMRGAAGEVASMANAEVMRIFGRALQTGTLPVADQRYVGQLIAQRTNLSQKEAEQRVTQGFEQVKTTLNEVETSARQAADEAREASAYGALWVFVTLLLGAFVACVMAVFGGRQRDAY